MRNGGSVVSRAIQREGSRTVFALAGAGHIRLLEALNNDGVEIVSSRHESATVLAADGYSRITGRVGFALVISKQGLSNTIGGLASASAACSPVVVLVARGAIVQDDPGSPMDDDMALVRPLVKWARTVHDPERLAEYVHHACHVARSGRPGPVVLSIPTDLLAAEVTERRVEDDPINAAPPVDPSPVAVEAAAALLFTAQRPMIVAGSGAVHAEVGLQRLAREFNIPVLGHSLGRGVVREDMETGFPWSLAQIAAKDADVVLVVGARLSDRLGFGLPTRFAADAQFIQVDIHAEELRRARPIDVPIVGDADRTTRAIADALARRIPAGHTVPNYACYIHEAMAARWDRIEGLGLSETGLLHPYRVARELMAQLPKDAIVVGDGADALNWMLAYMRIHQAPGYMDHYPSGSMGIGTPLALGAAAAARELANGGRARPVVLVSGDGSFGFYPSELNSMVLAKLPVIALIINDRAWGTERHGQNKAIGKEVNTDLGQVRFDRIAAGYGCHAEFVDEPGQVRGAIERAFAAGGPVVIDCWTDREAGALRKQDPRIQMIPHDDINTSRRPHVTPSIA